MEIFKTQTELKQYINSRPKSSSIGFVPTMGALHDGHLSLIKESKSKTDITVCSIYINPTQFNNQSDFEKYPVDHSGDIELLKKVGCDVLFLPKDKNEVYQNEKEFTVDLGNLELVLEGEHRPGHFEGVMRVVKLLFEIVQPNIAFFGLKDYQQYLVIQKMVKELKLNVEIAGCEIIREKSGLAMSSRNQRLSKDELRKALSLQEALNYCKNNIYKISISDLKKKCIEILSAGSNPEYFAICDGENLKEIEDISVLNNARAFVAASVGEVRLIDNMKI